jgi:hypothetical protein
VYDLTLSALSRSSKTRVLPLKNKSRNKSVSRYGVDLDYSSSSSASPSSSFESDSSTDYGSFSDDEDETSAGLAQRKNANWNKSSSKERKRRKQRKLSSRLETLLADANSTGGSPARRSAASDANTSSRSRRDGKTKAGIAPRGIEATLDEWDRWEMVSQQQALVSSTDRGAPLID